MFGINEVMEYIRYLRHKEELDRLIKKHILSTKSKCTECGFEYNTIEDVYEKLPIVMVAQGKGNLFICNGCREKALNRLLKESKILKKVD